VRLIGLGIGKSHLPFDNTARRSDYSRWQVKGYVDNVGLSGYTSSNTALGIYVYSLNNNGQHVSTRYRVIIRPTGDYVLVYERTRTSWDLIQFTSVYIGQV
jgi:hypothetical protein